MKPTTIDTSNGSLELTFDNDSNVVLSQDYLEEVNSTIFVNLNILITLILLLQLFSMEKKKEYVINLNNGPGSVILNIEPTSKIANSISKSSSSFGGVPKNSRMLIGFLFIAIPFFLYCFGIIY